MSSLHESRINQPTKALFVVLLFILVIFASVLSFPIKGQDNAPSQHDVAPPAGAGEYRISVSVGLVILPVVVTDRKGQAVSGLEKGDFQVLEDGRPQEISLFEPEDVPVTVGLVVDNSGSMAAKRPEVLAAAEEFAKSSNPRDQMFVVNFNQRVSMGLPRGEAFTSDVPQLLGALSKNPAAGNTALYDGLAVALKHLNNGTAERKALIVVSDGGDNASHITFQNLLSRAEASNAQIFALGVYDESYEGEDLSKLRRLAKVTGGKSYFPSSPAEMTGICRQIAQDLREQYTIGYQPGNPNSAGRYHTIRVAVMNKNDGKLHVSTRAGYLTPSEPVAVPVPDKASL